jgi:hypothetical protein
MKKRLLYICGILLLPTIALAQLTGNDAIVRAKDKFMKNPSGELGDYVRYQLRVVDSKLANAENHVYKLRLQPTFFKGERWENDPIDDCSAVDVIVNAHYDYESEFNYQNIEFTNCKASKHVQNFTANINIYKNSLRYKIFAKKNHEIPEWDFSPNKIELGLKVFTSKFRDEMIVRLHSKEICKVSKRNVTAAVNNFACGKTGTPYTLIVKPYASDKDRHYYFQLKQKDQPHFLESAVAW